MEYLVIIPAIYLLIECARIDNTFKSIKKSNTGLLQTLGIFSEEERIVMEKDLITGIKECSRHIILNYMLIIFFISITCITIIFWEYKPLYIFTRAIWLSLYAISIVYIFFIKNE